MSAGIDSDWARAVRDIVNVADQPEGGVHVVRLPGARADGRLAEVAQALEPLGYVLVDLDVPGTEELPEPVRHRHVALWCGTASARACAIRCVRVLAQASPRRHLVLCIGEASDAGRAGDAGAAPSTRVVPIPTRVMARQIARAERWMRRGRPRAAEAWMTAAVAASRRHAETGHAAQRPGLETALRMSEEAAALCHGGEWGAARARIRDVLRQRDLPWFLYADASAMFADTALARGELALARDWLASVVAEAELRRQPLPATVRIRCAELAFWLGHGHTPGVAPATSTPAPPASAGETGWLAISAWSRGQLATTAVLAAQLRTRWLRRDPHAALWISILSVLMGARDGSSSEREMRALSCCATDMRSPARLRALARVIHARAEFFTGRRDVASGTRRDSHEGDPSDRLLDALREKHDGSGVRRARPAEERAWLGFHSLLTERADMYLVDGVTGLLHVMEDAEDELSALAGGCQWVRKQAGASAVGIVSADQTRLIAAQGWKPTDLSAEIARILSGPARDIRAAPAADDEGGCGVPIRYGGVTVGHVVARARPADRAVVREAVQALAAVSGSALCARLDALTLRDQARDCAPEILGRSALIADVRQAIARAAATSFPVLIEGESGTGKELVARALHRLSPRRDHRFQAVNCAALTDDLVEAELFGHARGAFTGAVGPRAGLFEEAHGGTLFLDEISELSTRAQAKLLRVLQEREVRRVGENSARRVDVRPIAATNLPLADAVAGGRFRDDLRFRLAVVRIRLPPLRDRLEDLPLLAQVFWRRALAETGKRAVMGPDALARLARHSWPGNVRELQNVIAGLAVAAPARGRVSARHVSQILVQAAAGEDAGAMPLDAARRMFEQRLVAAALARHAGRRTAAARDLGLTRQGLTKAIRRLGLSTPAVAADPDEPAAGVA